MLARAGTILCIVTVALVSLVLVGAAPPADEAKGEDQPKQKVLEIVLKGEIEEQSQVAMPWSPAQTRLRHFTGSIRKATKDDAIKALIIRLRQPLVGLATLQELGDAIGEFKAANKKVYCYTRWCGNGDYMLGCSADHFAVAPGGAVNLIGLRAEAAFLKGVLDWAGVKVEVVNTGPHKSALDAFTRESMSEENRKVLNELLDDLYAQLVGAIAKGRKLTPEQVQQTIDNGPFLADDALKAKLVDQVAYYDAFQKTIEKDLGGPVDVVRHYHHLGRKGPELEDMNIFTLFAALRPQPAIPKTKRPKVVVIYATGMIADTQGFGVEAVRADVIGKAFEQAREDATVKAVVLRIDSPGGSAIESDLIWHEVQRTRKAGKPVVASMAGVAASGGYYIAMGADAIVAQPGTITGSIGVVGAKVILKDMYDKIGIKKEVFRRGKNAAMFSDYSALSDHERARVEALIQGVYTDFVTKAAAGRDMPVDQMRELATGRVWTARAAKAVGLVDQLGGLKEAYDLAIAKAGLEGEDVQPVILPREKSILEALFGGNVQAHWPAAGASAADALRRSLPVVQAAELFTRENVLTLMPYFIEIR